MNSSKYLPVALLAAGLAWPQVSAAQSEGLYISGGVGGVFPRDSDVDGPGVNSNVEFDRGPVGSIAIGSTLGGNLRGEIELSHREVDIDSVSGAAGSTGDVAGTALMFNGFYDFSTGSNFTPYLGAGVGPMRLDVNGAAPFAGARIDDDEWVVAAQAIAGIGYRVSDRLGLFTDYRYLHTAEADLTTSAGTAVETDYSEHRVMVGLRWSFNGPKPMPKAEPVPVAAPAPPPPPKAEPAPAPAPVANRNFLVFFDFDQSNLTEDAQAIVQAAARTSKDVPVTVIEATGHADRAGSDRYNLGLSQKRAEAVKAELIRLGVATDEIAILWKGEREPLVQTADGVREPQNRRVEIILK
ncbi:MAG: OmpA family protein [Alphaproteobacteria bacterium]